MNGEHAHPGMSRRQAVRLARRLGCTVEAVRGTGELRLRHPAWSRALRFNRRRKDAPRPVALALRRLQEQRP